MKVLPLDYFADERISATSGMTDDYGVPSLFML